MLPVQSVSLSDEAWARFLPSPSEMSGYDAATIAAGTPASELMERAGGAIAGVVSEWFSSEFGPEQPITVLCGPGNNGGDGMVVARHLRAKGASVSVVVVHASRYSAELTAQIGTYMSQGEQFFVFADSSEVLEQSAEVLDTARLQTLLDGSWIVIDALLGAGQTEAPRGAIRLVLECLCRARAQAQHGMVCISIDIPSGIDGDTGRVYDPHVDADITIAVELIKRGMMQYPARHACGRIVAVPVGIACDSPPEFCLVDDQDAGLALPARRVDVHKGDCGRVVVIAGSPSMPGAAALAAMAALRSGAGSVVQTLFGQIAGVERPEIIYELFSHEISKPDLPRLKELSGTAQCLIVGPGLGCSPASSEAIQELLAVLSELGTPAVVDADGLNGLALALRRNKGVRLENTVLTPHPGEMGRLLGIDAAKVQADRYGAVRRLAEQTGAVVVLKGAASITYARGRGLVNTSGTPALATAGSGDVLSGIIAGLIAQGVEQPRAAVMGVLFHGLAGEQASADMGGPIISSDIIAALPGVFRARRQLAAAEESSS